MRFKANHEGLVGPKKATSESLRMMQTLIGSIHEYAEACGVEIHEITVDLKDVNRLIHANGLISATARRIHKEAGK